MAHCAITAAQLTKGYIRRLGMRGPRRQVQFVSRQKGQTHTGQHRVGATAVQPPGVRCTTAYQSRVIGFPAGDYRRGPEAAGVHTTQDIATGRSACLSTEGLRGSLCTGHHHTRQLVTADRKVSSTLKSAQVLPLLKKAGLDRSLPVNYRPISNLSTVSKVLERLVLARLRPHLTNSKYFSKQQSAYRQGHSTKTALLDVLVSVHNAADSKEVTLLIGLDLSAAFDMVCHSTLVKRLQTEFGVSGTALSWIQSYLQDRTQFVKLGQHRSSETTRKSEYPRDPYLVRCCSPCIAAQSLTSSCPMVSDAINTPMTLSST